MLDIKEIRANADAIKTQLATRGGDAHTLIPQIIEIDEHRRVAETEKQTLQSERNTASKQIGALMGQGKKDEAEAAKADVKKIGDRIKELETQSDELTEKQETLLMSVPNLPHADCPVGADETANPEIRTWGEKPQITDPKDHVQLAEQHKLIDFENAAKISGSGFAIYTGRGAKLQRALINFLLDLQTQKHGYTEVNVPLLIRRYCMEGTGQLPKFEDDMYAFDEGAMFLAPTAEVPVTNILRETILAEDELPVKMTAQTACFRREAGSAGRDNKGIIRVHQFDKVELVQAVHPDKSNEMLEELTGHAEAALQQLGLHYRTIELCTGDLGFASQKTYDIEVWAPGQSKFLEVSSCSNFGDYQARRMRLRYKDNDGKNHFCHTLNGSGTALPRLYVALLEQNQNPDGTINIPPALVPYLGTEKID